MVVYFKLFMFLGILGVSFWIRLFVVCFAFYGIFCSLNLLYVFYI